jgi:hypothetical protein
VIPKGTFIRVRTFNHSAFDGLVGVVTEHREPSATDPNAGDYLGIGTKLMTRTGQTITEVWFRERELEELP